MSGVVDSRVEPLLPLVWFTALTAGVATILVAPLAIGLAWMLVRRPFPGKAIVETLVLMPLVVPPVATGLVLLKLLGRRGPLGAWTHEALGLDVAFTGRAVVIAMGVMAFPIFVLTARAAFEAVDPRLEQVAATLGASPWRRFLTISLPLAWPGLLAAALLAFARALGEFGATMLVAGGIPGRTLTLSTAIWQRVQLGDDEGAARLMAISFVLALFATAGAGLFARRPRRAR